MLEFIFWRIAQAVPVLLGVAVISFAFTELSGNPVRELLGPKTSPETLAKITAHYGYDKPRHERFANYMGRLAHGDLGYSVLKDGLPVRTLIARGMRVTFKVALGGILVAVGLGLTLGLLSAWRPNSILDYFSSATAALGISFPAFFLGMLLLLLFAVHWRFFPVGGYEPGSFPHLVLPCLTLGLISTASIARLTRNCVLETLKQDYARTGRAKGLGEWRVLLAHAFPNAMVPVVTVIGSDFASLLVGAVLTETVFQIPGMGIVINDAIAQRDLPVVMGCCLVFALIFVTINLLVDVLYAFLDPRIRHAH